RAGAAPAAGRAPAGAGGWSSQCSYGSLSARGWPRVRSSRRCFTRASPQLSRDASSAPLIGRRRRPWLIVVSRVTTSPHCDTVVVLGLPWKRIQHRDAECAEV